MFEQLFEIDAKSKPPANKEGELFKAMHIYGVTFEIKYGYYEESDRLAMFAEPMAIYPDFQKTPQYTEDGVPFATAMQEPCQWFTGKEDENSTCEDCSYYQGCEELLGICTCEKNRKLNDLD